MIPSPALQERKSSLPRHQLAALLYHCQVLRLEAARKQVMG